MIVGEEAAGLRGPPQRSRSGAASAWLQRPASFEDGDRQDKFFAEAVAAASDPLPPRAPPRPRPKL